MILAPWPARGGDHGARPLSWCQCVRARRAVAPGTHTQEEVCAMSTADSHAALHEAATRVLAEHDLVLEELVVRRESGTTRRSEERRVGKEGGGRGRARDDTEKE